MSEPSRLPGFLAAFAFRSFRRLWIGAFLSSIGTWTQDVALSWLIHTRIGDPFYLGLRTFAAELPLVTFMLVGGAQADRVDRRRILLASQVFQMSMAGSLGVLYGLDRLGIGAILVIAFLTGLAQSQSAPTYQATLTSLVPRDHIPNAANVLSFVAVIVAIARIELPPVAASGRESLGQSLKAGIRHVVESPILSVLTLLGAAASLLAFPLITFLPVVAGDVLRTGAAGYSLLLTSLGVGAIAGAVTTAQRGSVPGRGRLMLLAFMTCAAATAGAVLSGRQWLAMALLAAAGFSLTTAFSTLNSLVQEHAPNELRGRVLSIFGLAFRGGMPVGSLVAGGLVNAFGAPAVLAAFASVLFLIAAAIRLHNARLRSL